MPQLGNCRKGGWLNNKHNCVLSNACLSNALYRNRNLHFFKIRFYFRFRIETRAVISWVTPTTAFLMRQLIVASRLGRTEYQLLLMKISWWYRNVKIRYKFLVVIDEFLTVSLYQPNEFISRKYFRFHSPYWIQSRHSRILSARGIRTSLKSANYFRFVSQTTGEAKRPNLWTACKFWWKSVKNCGRNT